MTFSSKYIYIIFPAITIGLALLLFVLELLWLKTKDKNYISLYRFFSKFFAINFAVGVITGIPMAFQFGTNWAKFTQFSAPAVGPLFAAETLSAFFLEAVFIGIMLFGWKKVHPMVHLFSTFFVLVGVHNSAFWILVINSFMHTPSGVELIDGVVHVTSWWNVIFNPSMPYRLAHMLTAAYLTGALLVAGVLAYYLIKNREVKIAKTGFSVALWFIAILAPTQFVIGDLHGLNTVKNQPAKIAAMEGIWETKKAVPFIIAAIPSQTDEKNYFELKIPYAASIFLTHSLDGEVKGLKEWKREDRPTVWLVFWSFRVMLGLGAVYLLIGLLSLYLRFKGTLYTNKFFLKIVAVFGYTGSLAVIAGWFVTEIGRQPWIVQGILRIKDASSKNLSNGEVTFSLVAIVVLYILILIPLFIYIKRLFTKGLEDVKLIEVYGEDNVKKIN